ncbi:SDR family NAD(P)-dependent oxidoreductase [Paroceanicella profunda]|uniref:SDR family NAD(P)-dependent oxidoreductase n=1 Tax=Paroceanicella profunda TaxID=2579971 RepID=A0A5B8FHA2_9RHOB|nr:SDR family NAD(P)-dependent oxidoreductase [Paroceanicella profunda]QDL92201.1 SDR family NAD(P)-dependent oxidoreductase [Paroceanicella profunda]
MPRTVLITGCSSGIGRDAALTLAARGWHVFATCRRAADCAALAAEGHAGIESFPLDYTDEAGIAAALARTGVPDALFNNGAFALPGAMEDVPRGGLRAIFEANLFGPFDLIHRLMPGMLARGSGRIVNCSSVLGVTALRFRGAYCGTKHAMEGMTDALRLENLGGPVHVSLIEPGPIGTLIREKSRPHFERWIDWQHAPKRATYEAEVLPRLHAPPGRPDRFELTPAAVTRALIHALESPRPKPRYRVTLPTLGAEALRRLLTTRARDRILRNQ